MDALLSSLTHSTTPYALFIAQAEEARDRLSALRAAHGADGYWQFLYVSEGSERVAEALICRDLPHEEALACGTGLLTVVGDGRDAYLFDETGEARGKLDTVLGTASEKIEHLIAFITDASAPFLMEALAEEGPRPALFSAERRLVRRYPTDARTEKLIAAYRLLTEGEHTFALVGEDTRIVKDQRGIAPMADLLAEGRRFPHMAVADRIVGRAAAHLFLLAEVEAVYGEVMSEEAYRLLRADGVMVRYGTLTAAIRNRKGDGLCPMELATAGVTTHEEAFHRIQETRAALQKK